MLPEIELEECLRDSPKFRAALEMHEADIEQLETKLDKVLKTCGVMVDTGKTYVSQQAAFTSALYDLTAHFRSDADVASHLNRMTHAMQEVAKYQTILLDQASRTVLQNLSSFVKKDLRGVKESRHYFEKTSADLDAALSRNSAASRHRPAEVEEATNLLAATQSAFRHTSVQYCRAIALVQAKKRGDTLSALLSYLHACSTFFHQGTDLCQDLDPFFKKLADEVAAMRLECGRLEKDDCHTRASTTVSTADKMEGYLFKRTSNAFKTWNRRWFSLQDSQLVYRKRTADDVTVMEEDLRLCSVKPASDGDRRFCFEVLSPSKSHTLQADSEEMYLRWISAVQAAISSALQASLSPDQESRESRRPSEAQRKPRLWEQLLSIAGNNACCDCGSPDPRWASINLGITLCIECCGVHRGLGVQLSKVRSLTLDAWETEAVKVMAELGNETVNRVYEACVPPDAVRAHPTCSQDVRLAWISGKYRDRLYVRKDACLTAATPAASAVQRKWSVRRLRRRARSSEAKRLPQLPHTPEDNTESEASPPPVKTPVVSPALAEFSRRLLDTEEAEEVVEIGVELAGPVGSSLELSSDQDSTGGEEELVDSEPMSLLAPDRLLYKAAAAHNLPVMCEALALGADACHVREGDRRSPLHAAILSGSVMAPHYLLLNGARIDCQDADGATPLHLATQMGNTGQVCLLLKQGADQRRADNAGSTALALAVARADADIVTLLRIAALDREMRDDEDSLFEETVRDFSQMHDRGRGKTVIEGE